MEAADFVLVEKVVSWVTNVRCLTISGTILLRDSEVVTGFLGAIGKWLREMSHLTLCGVAERPWLRKIVVATQFVALRTINFHEAEEGEDEGEGGKLVLRSEVRISRCLESVLSLTDHISSCGSNVCLIVSWGFWKVGCIFDSDSSIPFHLV